jgi:hypothetical protein
MSRSPSIIPENTDREICIVLDDFGLLARVWRETNDAQPEMLIRDLHDGQYEDRIRIVALNTAQGRSRDLPDIANELRQRCADRGEIRPSFRISSTGKHPFR